MDEVHARPVDIVPPVCRVRRVAVTLPDCGTDGVLERLGSIDCFRLSERDRNSRQLSFLTAACHVTWEFHTEFITVTWRTELTNRANWPDDIKLEALSDAHLIGAMRVDVIGDIGIPQRLLPGFNLPSLCLSDIEAGAAQVATDFVPDADTFTRFELAAGALTDLRRSIVVRRLLEIETYRTMPLMGLPWARDVAPTLHAIETELTQLTARLSSSPSPAAIESKIDELHMLSVRSCQLSERVDFRFAASRAYGDILRTRLAGLRETSSPLGSTLTNYIGNRVDPGLATCAAMEKRLGVVSNKIERAIGLLDIRIGIDIQLQSATILDSIASTTRSQLSLQHTVEGLSTIAVSYYLLGILGYVIAGPVEHLLWHNSAVLSLIAPVVVVIVWMGMRFARRSARILP